MSQEEKDIFDNIDYQAPNGESWEDVKKRTIDFFKERENGVSQVFTHGGLICAYTYDLGQRDMITHSSVLGLEIADDGEAKKLLFNWEYPFEDDI